MPQTKPHQGVISKTDWQKLPEHLRKYFQEVEQDARPTRPCIVADIFMGSGTVAMVAAQHNRNYVGIELNEQYAQMARERAQSGETGITVKEARIGQMALGFTEAE